tara:strand:+ start:11097 stop:11288 length:192 start_codon:yes stop_codon:yes gene_type:complete
VVFVIGETVLGVVLAAKRLVMAAVSINRLIHCIVVRVEIDVPVVRAVETDNVKNRHVRNLLVW